MTGPYPYTGPNGGAMSFAGGRIVETFPDADAEIERLRAAHEDLVALRQYVLIYLGTEEPRTAAGRAQAEVLRDLCRPALPAEPLASGAASPADTQRAP